MSIFDSIPPRPDIAPIPSQTFCTYLAKQFIAKRGFQHADIPEANALFPVSDFVLTLFDGMTLTILCMIDREAHPNKVFALRPYEVIEIGEACLKHSGGTDLAKMPIHFMILEVGPGSSEQQQRLKQFKRPSFLSNVIPTAIVVDTTMAQVWQNSFSIGPASYPAFLRKLLLAPREADSALVPPTVVTSHQTFPALTTAILAILFAVFAVEIIYGIGPWKGLLEPTINTVIGFGGLIGAGVFQNGEWYRLLAAPFLHLDAGHLLMNAIALFIAGNKLESLIGRAWFGAIYASSALCGSIASLAFNPDSIVSVGASGAIMGLFVAMLMVGWHFPPGATRGVLQMNAVYVLIPSLLPLTGALQGQRVDYGAHFGGAIGGAVTTFIMLAIWPQTDARPRFQQAAAAIAIVGIVALTYPVASILEHYQAMALTAQFIPSDKLPKTNADMRARAVELIKQYPHDPRPRFLRAADLLDANDLAGAELEARAGLAEENAWRLILSPQLDSGLRVVLAIAINGTRHEEALSTARPACVAVKDGPMRKMLDDRRLCGNVSSAN